MSPDLRLSPCGADCFSRMGGPWKPTASTGTAPFTCMKLSPAILVLRMMKNMKSTILPYFGHIGVGDADTGWVFNTHLGWSLKRMLWQICSKGESIWMNPLNFERKQKNKQFSWSSKILYRATKISTMSRSLAVSCEVAWSAGWCWCGALRWPRGHRTTPRHPTTISQPSGGFNRLQQMKNIPVPPLITNSGTYFI